MSATYDIPSTVSDIIEARIRDYMHKYPTENPACHDTLPNIVHLVHAIPEVKGMFPEVNRDLQSAIITTITRIQKSIPGYCVPHISDITSGRYVWDLRTSAPKLTYKGVYIPVNDPTVREIFDEYVSDHPNLNFQLSYTGGIINDYLSARLNVELIAPLKVTRWLACNYFNDHLCRWPMSTTVRLTDPTRDLSVNLAPALKTILTSTTGILVHELIAIDHSPSDHIDVMHMGYKHGGVSLPACTITRPMPNYIPNVAARVYIGSIRNDILWLYPANIQCFTNRIISHARSISDDGRYHYEEIGKEDYSKIRFVYAPFTLHLADYRYYCHVVKYVRHDHRLEKTSYLIVSNTEIGLCYNPIWQDDPTVGTTAV